MAWGSGAGDENLADVVFDFEPFIADILPALNATGHHQSAAARKAAIDKASVSAPEGMSRQKLDEKYHTIVCRHWLRGLCMKGETCEFLHQYDMSRMPVCRWGDQCKVKDCPYKHVNEADQPQCVFYQQGFCEFRRASLFRRRASRCRRHPRHAVQVPPLQAGARQAPAHRGLLPRHPPGRPRLR